MAKWLGRLLRNRRAGEATLAWNRKDLEAPGTIDLRSTAFANGGPIPRLHAGQGVGDNVSPRLSWSGVPKDAAELVLLIEDPDVPFPRPIAHLSLSGIPVATTSIPQGGLNAGDQPFGAGIGSFGRAGYAGPRPIPGHGPHSYVFQIFALDSPLTLPPAAKPEEITEAMAGHVLARGRLDGTYER
jgi:Raf kinase inhibitor-like YbhB/YbcL family protein